MTNRSVEKVVKIIQKTAGEGLPKSKKLKTYARIIRKEYPIMLKTAQKIFVPKKIWRYIEDLSFLADYFSECAPVPYDNQVLVFLPQFALKKLLQVEFIHVYKYSEENDYMFPRVKDMGWFMPSRSYIPVGDIGMMLCLRRGTDFPILISLVIVDGQLYICKSNNKWSLITPTNPEEIFEVMVAIMGVLALNCLAFISEPEKAYEFKKKLMRLPKENGRGKERKYTASAKWRRTKIKKVRMIYEEKEGEKRDWTAPDYQVEIPTHVRTYNYCSNCKQFVPLRFITRDQCPRCDAKPWTTFIKKVVVESFLKWRDLPQKDSSCDIFLSE